MEIGEQLDLLLEIMGDISASLHQISLELKEIRVTNVERTSDIVHAITMIEAKL
jgi:hypothetical protein